MRLVESSSFRGSASNYFWRLLLVTVLMTMLSTPTQSMKVFGWGSCNLGQLGIDVSACPTSGSADPSPIVALETLVSSSGINSIATSVEFSTMRLSNSSMITWGSNSSGQLGPGVALSFPTLFPASSTLLDGKVIARIITGRDHVMVITSDEEMYAWGAGSSGGLGNGLTDDSAFPVRSVAIELAAQPFTVSAFDFSCGDQNCYALKDGAVSFVWGENSAGQLALNATSSAQVTPVSPIMVGLDSKYITKVIPGSRYTFFLTSDGWLYSVGLSDYIGRSGTVDEQLYPLPIDMINVGSGTKNSNITQVSIGPAHAIFLTHAGLLFGFGDNDVGQLGVPISATVIVPIAVPIDAFAGVQVTQVRAFATSSVALTSTGEVFTWGGASGVFTSTAPVLHPNLTVWIVSGFASAPTPSSHIFALANPQIPCTSPVPNTAFPFSCIGGVWIVREDVVLSTASNNQLVIQSATLIVGDLTVPPGSTIVFQGIGGDIDVTGCVQMDGDVELVLGKADIEALQKSNSKELLLITGPASCADFGSLSFKREWLLEDEVAEMMRNASESKVVLKLTITEKSCKRVSATSQVVTEGGKASLKALYTVDSSRCNIWWIALLASMGGVLAIIAIVLTIIKLSPAFKMKVRPYAGTR